MSLSYHETSMEVHSLENDSSENDRSEKYGSAKYASAIKGLKISGPDMITKAENPVDSLAVTDLSAITQAYFEIAHLKNMFRQGWLKREISENICESVAEHSFGVAMLSMLLLPQRPELDALKVIRFALIHDLGEVYAGDVTPHDGVPKVDKVKMEQVAVEQILGKLAAGQDLLAAWHDYESQATPEARFVKEVDRLELVMQTAIYQQSTGLDGTEFYRGVADVIKSSPVIEEFQALRAAFDPS
jgi:putative hydrolase of HD superfamily